MQHSTARGAVGVRQLQAAVCSTILTIPTHAQMESHKSTPLPLHLPCHPRIEPAIRSSTSSSHISIPLPPPAITTSHTSTSSTTTTPPRSKQHARHVGRPQQQPQGSHVWLYPLPLLPPLPRGLPPRRHRTLPPPSPPQLPSQLHRPCFQELPVAIASTPAGHGCGPTPPPGSTRHRAQQHKQQQQRQQLPAAIQLKQMRLQPAVVLQLPPPQNPLPLLPFLRTPSLHPQPRRPLDQLLSQWPSRPPLPIATQLQV